MLLCIFIIVHNSGSLLTTSLFIVIPIINNLLISNGDIMLRSIVIFFWKIKITYLFLFYQVSDKKLLPVQGNKV